MMLNVFLVLMVCIIWPSIFIYYWRAPIRKWIDNRYGPDKKLPAIKEHQKIEPEDLFRPPPKKDAPQ
jgi:hypothetical protein